MTFDHTKTFDNIRRTVAKVNKDTMKMLVSLPDFQERVKKIREKYGIPSTGLEDNKASEEWHNYLYESDERINNWLRDCRAIWTCCKKLQHDPRYIEHIRRYIMFDQITAPFCNGNASMSFPDWRNNPDRRDFSIKVYHKLTKDEMDLIMHDLEGLMNHYIPSSQKKLKPKPELERDLAVIEKTKKIGEMVVTHDGAHEYSYNDLVAEVYEDDSENNNTLNSDKKRKESLRKSKTRTEQDIKDRLGWDTTT